MALDVTTNRPALTILVAGAAALHPIMLREWLVPTAVLPLYERLSRRRSRRELQRLQTLQWRPAEELEARALSRLRDLLAHAAAHVPYYRDLFRQHGVDPGAVRRLDDLAAVPVTGKPALRAAFPERTVADNVPRSRRIPGTTSGSTGTPFRFFGDRAAEASRHASYLFFLDWSGAALGDTRVVIAYPSYAPPEPLVLRAGRRLLLGERHILLSGVDLTADVLRALARRVRGRYFIQAYPSYASRLARSLTDDGVDLDAYPTVVVGVAETLTSLDARVIARAFRCPVVSHYSTWEVLHLAQTCPENSDRLHVNSERAIVRIARDDGSPAAPGERGRVVLTDLANEVMPFINYDVGDWAVAGERCPCGRGLPTIRELEGRVGEIIRTLDGRHIAPGALTRRITARVVDRVWEFQAAQTAPDAVVLRVVPTARFTAAFCAELQRDLEELFGPSTRVSIEPVEQIPLETSGKRLIVKPLADRGGSA